jgi:hypothetical protein
LCSSALLLLRQHYLWPFIFKAKTLLARKPLELSDFALNGRNLIKN